jgi:hypothetical protein
MKNIEQIIGIEGTKGGERRDRMREIGALLYPSALHPDLAIEGVIKGKKALDSKQLERLASYLGVTVSSFFTTDKWKARTKNGAHYFENGEYKAELCTTTWVTKVFHKESLFHEEIIHSGSITLREYLKKIEVLVDFNEGRRHSQRQHNTN